MKLIDLLSSFKCYQVVNILVPTDNGKMICYVNKLDKINFIEIEDYLQREVKLVEAVKSIILIWLKDEKKSKKKKVDYGDERGK